MSTSLIFAPVLAQMLLTVVLYVVLQGAKVRAAAAGEVDEARRALHDDAWPDRVQQINHCIRNQFELPVLFYVLCLVSWALGMAGLLAQVVAWLFVASRVMHAREHIGRNHVPRRRRWFTLGVMLVIVLMLLVAWRLVAAALPV